MPRRRLSASLTFLLAAVAVLGGLGFGFTSGGVATPVPGPAPLVRALPSLGGGGAINQTVSALSWTNIEERTSRLPTFFPAFVDDVPDREVIEFGGGGSSAQAVFNSTYSFADGSWTELSPIVSPAPREGDALAYSSWAGTVYMFGGEGPCRNANCSEGAPVYNDIWSFQNNTWTNVTPVGPSPPPTAGAVFANDPVDLGLLLFGGDVEQPNGSFAPSNQTWLWNGSAWHRLAPLHAPSPRYFASMAWEPNGEDVLFGGLAIGRNSTGSFPYYLNDTWTYESGVWTNVTSGPAPPPFPFGSGLALDVGTGDLVSVSRFDASFTTNTTWELSDNHWSIIGVTGALPDAGVEELCTDTADGAVLDAPFPNDFTTEGLDTFELNGTAWSEVASVNPSEFPQPRDHAGLAFDSATGTAVLFGGVNSTTELNDTGLFYPDGTYQSLSGLTSPSAREGMGFVFDSSADTSVLFGGGRYDGGGYNDTWTFRADTWNESLPTVAPPPERNGCLANDPANGGVLLFGGFSNTGAAMSETWVWNATGWHDLSGGAGPSGRGYAACAWDPVANEVLLVGGATSTSVDAPAGTYFSDSWGFNGTSWNELATLGPGGHPTADGALLPIGPAGTGGLALIPGWNGTDVENATYTWTGSAWGLDDSVSSTSPRMEGAGVTFDPAIDTSVLITGDVATTTGRPLYITNVGEVLDNLVVRSVVGPGSVPGSASFSATPTGGSAPFLYRWDFGDGTSSPNASGTHQYPAAGRYSGTLRVSDRWGTNLSGGFTIVVGGPSAAGLNLSNASVSPLSGVAPLTVSYKCAATGGLPPYQYLWAFGDGTTSRNATGTHTFGSAGTFAVTLKVTDANSSSTTRSWTVTVTNGPTGTQRSTGGGGSSGLPGWTWYALGVLAVALVGVAVLWYVRRTPPTLSAGEETEPPSSLSDPGDETPADGGSTDDEPFRET